MWMSLVAMNVWMRGRSESLTAFQAASMSCLLVRASPQMTGPFDLPRDRLHGLEVAGRGDREAGLDHVHAEPRELVGDLELLLLVQRDARRLLAVAQGRVEDQDPVRAGVAVRCAIAVPGCSCRSCSFSVSLVRSSLLGLRLRGRHALFPPRGEQEKREKRELRTTSDGGG